ncbi:MAG: pyruvate kinase [candidate division Zixibacteria bacterium]|nr:pyruvate kinase [candidate division Zixibacteria bacterium]
MLALTPNELHLHSMIQSKRTKILCTLGPATDKKAMLERLIRAGMNMARINMSHGVHDEHARRIRRLAEASRAVNVPIGVLVDLQGPKLRIGELTPEGINLKKGQTVHVGGRKSSAPETWIPLDAPTLARELDRGDTILLADGSIALKVTDTDKTALIVRVTRGGHLTSRKGLNVPGRALSVPAFTTKDKADLAFALKHNADFVALSFVRTAKDVRAVKNALKRHKTSKPVVAKIEKPQALDDIDNIIDVADGIMVARGDLGVELSVERVPAAQKTLIQKCAAADRWVIVATQMLESMIESATPTRAEASDIANAVYDGADCLMLSGETAIGKYPDRAVDIMTAICRQSEDTAWLDHPVQTLHPAHEPDLTLRKSSSAQTAERAMVDAALVLLRESDASALWVFTQSGRTAQLVSKSRPEKPVLAFSPHQDTLRLLSGQWGIRPLHVAMVKTTDEMVTAGEQVACERKCARKGDRVIVLAGQAPTIGATDIIKIHHVRK